MRPLPTELDAKIDEIKSWMFDGDQKLVAMKSRKSESWVSQVLNKRVGPDRRVLDAGIEVMNQNKARFECTPKMKIA